ncbi:MAG: phosphoenolpyruvate carboxykinase (GTP) [Desulfobacterales bacterium]|jgi:phosphoenolpyruvate carboxykinase (GTP)|nr:phosphoenolpyruvate carboxykinase (GTP) [Desulfobacteraceae bacterium]MBT4364340.1 phosphoenolpyruvate carboxykinase (GTP) [Desulfobacteraceae bacterium]MBT7085800.1 phosphoenolpyruvate carboxykinase (GTP) [Desulfobacterales bacterium]MBT7697958.1 phosphoenolpyruvate carboxykinase (GTP) [Desulfobacterales bacterium]
MALGTNGKDILIALGGITSSDEAMQLCEKKMDDKQFSRIKDIKNAEITLKIANAIVMCDPDSIFVNTGSKEDRQFIRELSLKNGEEATLPMENHTIHYDLKDEQGRIVDRTFYIANEGEHISSLANKMIRDEAMKDVLEKMTGIMKGKTMMIGFYMRGPVGSPVSNPALEITSSAYVSHSAEILYRNAYADFEKEVEKLGHFFTNIHSEGLNRTEDLPNARVFMDRSYQTTYSFNCTYAGNTLLLKKGNHRFAVDKAVRKNLGNELSEHMFITGIDGPDGRITWCAGAAPSGCGKTTTAMAGSHFVGDDLAQLWISEDGSVRSINPECGIFGIVEDVNGEGDPMLMELLRKPGAEVIWSNVLIDENGVPHWTGSGEEQPAKGKNFQGDWEKGMKDDKGKEVPISHPNSRCTLASTNLGNYSELAESPEGVETRVITYSGRDSDTMPPVWAAPNSDHGVVIGACIVSAATATEVGATGVKRAPWANAPFIPGALGDYMDAQFKFFGSSKIEDGKRPVMAGLNYFLTEEARGGSSKNLIGEKRDVKVWMSWLERHVNNEVEVIKTPIGNLPKLNDLKKLFKEIIGKEYTEDLYVKQFSLYVDNILARIDLQTDAYGKEDSIPPRLFEVLKEQKEGLLAIKEKFGVIVKPSDLE